MARRQEKNLDGATKAQVPERQLFLATMHEPWAANLEPWAKSLEQWAMSHEPLIIEKSVNQWSSR